jgi:para-nitrobenzyl esterase
MKLPALAATILAFTLVPTGARAAEQGSGPVVKVSGGQIRGRIPAAGPGAVFKGIPFAQPPTGNLRWREPMPVKPWKGLREAAEFGPKCFQNSGGSEDCLYLNVWSAEWPVKTRKPVMVWVHGGANLSGSAMGSAGIEPPFEGDKLAARGVVLVTVQHRLGVFGFLAHPELTRASKYHASGNWGLMDLLAALQWVQGNIAKFGGDPTNVTMFGHSSGSYDIQLLMASPLSKGLFHRVIPESGQMLSFGGSMSLAKAERFGEQIAEALKAPAGAAAIEFLRQAPPEDLLKTATKVIPTGMTGGTGLLTTVDGRVLPRLPGQVFAAGQQLPVTMMIGTAARESATQLQPEALKKAIEDKYGDLAPRALEIYGLTGGEQEKADPLYGNAAAQWGTDTVQRCAAVLIAEWNAAAGHPTFQYQFDLPVPGREEAGAVHGAELAFVFGHLTRFAYTERDKKISDIVQQYWVNFARTGDPNGNGLPAWPRFDTTRRPYMEFTENGPVAKENLRHAFCTIYAENALRQLKR